MIKNVCIWVFFLSLSAQAKSIEVKETLFDEINRSYYNFDRSWEIENYERFVTLAKSGDITAKGIASVMKLNYTKGPVYESKTLDIELAKDYLREAISQNVPYALVALASAYRLSGEILEKYKEVLEYPAEEDFSKVYHYLKKAADAGDYRAQKRLTDVFYVGKEDKKGYIPRQRLEMLMDTKKYADSGNAISQLRLAAAYSVGAPYEGFKPDYGKSFELTRKAYENGLEKALPRYAEFFSSGIVVKRDYKKSYNMVKDSDYKYYYEKDMRFIRVNYQKIDLLHMMSDCQSLATTKLFGIKLMCASREQLRNIVKSSGAIVDKEDDRLVGDAYYSSSLLPDSKSLHIMYTVDNLFSNLVYEFELGQRSNIERLITEKYGKGTKLNYGQVWDTKDGIRIETIKFQSSLHLYYYHVMHEAQMQSEENHYEFLRNHAASIEKEKLKIEDQKKMDYGL